MAWKIVENGKIKRYFTYADGQVLHNEGQQTPAEKQLNLCDLSGLNLDSATEKIYADMEQFEEPSELISLEDEDKPARLCELLTGQNPLKFDGMPTALISERGIIGYIA